MEQENIGTITTGQTWHNITVSNSALPVGAAGNVRIEYMIFDTLSYATIIPWTIQNHGYKNDPIDYLPVAYQLKKSLFTNNVNQHVRIRVVSDSGRIVDMIQ